MKTTIQFDRYHNDKLPISDCQIFIALTGEREFILEQLTALSKLIQSEAIPSQGTSITATGTSSIIRPKWEGHYEHPTTFNK